MRLLQLNYFKVLAEKQHLQNAAEELHVSAPSLSSTIKRLEDELGVELFDRVGRNIKLNNNGEKFYRHVNSVINELEIAKKELLSNEKSDKKVINVATSTHVLWEEPIADFIKTHLGIYVNHIALKVDKLNDEKFMSQFDLIITALNDMPLNIYEHSILVSNDKPVLAVYSDHRFANRREVSLFEAKNEAFVALSKGYSSRNYFDTMCEMAGFIPNVVAEGDYSLRSKLVSDRVGIAFSTVMGSRSEVLKGLKFVEIVEPVNQRVQSIFWKKGISLPTHIQLFKDFIIDYYKDYDCTL